MSRETSSMLLRFGINNFWSNSISTSRTLYSNMHFDSFFNTYLKNYFLVPLKIQYKKTTIILYIFYYKNEKLTFIKKYFIWKKIKLNRLLVRKKYNFLAKNNNLKKIKRKMINLKIISLLNKIFLMKIFFWYVKTNKENCLIFKKLTQKNFNFWKKKAKTGRSFLKKSAKNKNYNLRKKSKNFNIKKKLQKFFYSKKKTNKHFNFPEKKRRKNYKSNIKLKKINFILKLKKLNMICQIILNSYNNNFMKVVFKPALKKLLYNKMPFFFKYIKYTNNKKNIYTLLIALIFNKSFIINKYVSDIIKNTKNKKHIKNLIVFVNLIKLLFAEQFVSLKGYKFFISGRLNGKLRKSSFGFKLGTLKLLSFSTTVNYSCNVIHTQYGCFSLKSWLCIK